MRLLRVAAIVELMTGLLLLVTPTVVVRLLMGQDLAPENWDIARVAGLALIGLGIACWPGPPALGLLVYSAGAAVLLVRLGLTKAAGPILWPGVALHIALSWALARSVAAARAGRKAPSPPGSGGKEI